MHRVDSDGHQNGKFTNGENTTGSPITQATRLEADWLNSVQEELIGVLKEAGVAPEKADNNQLKKAIYKLSGFDHIITKKDGLMKLWPKLQNGDRVRVMVDQEITEKRKVTKKNIYLECDSGIHLKHESGAILNLFDINAPGFRLSNAIVSGYQHLLKFTSESSEYLTIVDNVFDFGSGSEQGNLHTIDEQPTNLIKAYHAVPVKKPESSENGT